MVQIVLLAATALMYLWLTLCMPQSLMFSMTQMNSFWGSLFSYDAQFWMWMLAWHCSLGWIQ